MHGHPVDGEALLAHGEFVRALARKLVFDDDRVDDVVQETGLAALEHAPERPRSLLRIVIEKGFEASGRLLDTHGKPVVSAQVRFVPAGHDAPQRAAQTDSEGRFAVSGLRDGEYRVEMWRKVLVDAGDPMPEWQPVGTVRARDTDVERRMK